MRRSLSMALVSWGYQAARNRSRRLSLYLCASIVLLAVVPAWGDPGRGVNVNGNIYKIYLQKGTLKNSYTINAARQSAANFLADPTGIFVAEQTWRLQNPDKSDYQLCRATTLAPGEGLAVLGNKILYAYTADASCTNSSGMLAFVATFDLTVGADGVEAGWIPGSDTTTTPPNPRTLGWVNKCCNSGAGTGSGAAIVVLNNQLYVFTDNGTYQSDDGIRWSLIANLFLPTGGSLFNNKSYEPLDAVAINPPNAPARAVIVYGIQDAPGAHYDTLAAATWDGQSTTVDPSLQFFANSFQIVGLVSLLPGTANMGIWPGNPLPEPAAKEPAVQLFAANAILNSTTNAVGAIKHWEYRYTNLTPFSHGTWVKDGTDHPGSGGANFWVFPTFEAKCDSSGTAYLNQGTSEVLHANWKEGSTPQELHAQSDWLVPQNKENEIACNQISGTMQGNNTVDYSNDVAKHYWTLVGVILGTPPFVDSHLLQESPIFDFDSIHKLSNVTYSESTLSGHESSSSMSNQLMVSAGAEVRIGMADATHVTVSDDVGWKHAWESSHGDKSTSKLTWTKEMGTDLTSADNLGKPGWALFSAPQLIVQNWQVYAYDYNYHDGTGTPLDQNMQTIEQAPSGASIQQVEFDLDNPAGSNSLMAGMGPFANSQNLGYWINPGGYIWESGTDWLPILGLGTRVIDEPNPGDKDKHANALTFAEGSGSGLTYTVDGEHFDTTGHTNEVDFSETMEVGAGTKLAGVKAHLTVGYQGVFTFESKTTTGSGSEFNASLYPVDCGVEVTGFSITNNIVTFQAHNFSVLNPTTPRYRAASLNVPADKFSFPPKEQGGFQVSTYLNQLMFTVLSSTTSQIQASFTHADVPFTTDGSTAYASDCVKELTVQPYWLRATDKDAPWIPTAFKGTALLSANMPWCVTWQVTHVIPNPISGVAGSYLGQALAPLNAGGRIVNGSGGGEGGDPYSHYFIEGGRMAIVDHNGIETRIPMTADQFDPSKGVSIEVEGMSWSSAGAKGSWKRGGNIWTFQTDPSAQPHVVLSLDFGSATYDLQIQKADLNGRVLAGVTNTRLILTVNQLYTFQTALQHDIDIAWRWSQPTPDSLTAHVTSFQGRYNSATQSGNMSLAGTLPAVLPAFGDLEIDVNSHPYLVRLLNFDGFQQAFQSGGVLKYAKNGLILVVDFGNKTWSATFNNKAFSALAAPRSGKFRAQLLVGGHPWLNAENAVLNYSANLTLRR
jgi:hypothetical protein